MIVIPDVYTAANLQNMRPLLQDAGSASAADLLAAVDARLGEMQLRGHGNLFATCPICAAPMQRVAVNNGPGAVVDDGSTVALICTNRPSGSAPWRPYHCGHTEYR